MIYPHIPAYTTQIYPHILPRYITQIYYPQMDEEVQFLVEGMSKICDWMAVGINPVTGRPWSHVLPPSSILKYMEFAFVGDLYLLGFKFIIFLDETWWMERWNICLILSNIVGNVFWKQLKSILWGLGWAMWLLAWIPGIGWLKVVVKTDDCLSLWIGSSWGSLI